MDALSLIEAPSQRESALRYKTLRLVLFVGRALPLDAARRETMQREGLRCIGLPGLQEAVAASRAAHLDAIVVDAAELQPEAKPLLKQLQQPAHRCPMIVIDRPKSEMSELIALSYGASAYLVGPVPPQRLLAHLQALLRLSSRPIGAPPPAGQHPTVPGNWSVDAVRSCMHRPDRTVPLTEVQLALLQCLFDAGYHIVSRGRLHDALPARRELDGRTVDVYIHRLRRHLARERVTDFQIRAVRARGYRLVATDPAGAEPVGA